jgi:RimJ/RimL family protein N-acetyltransferase
MTAQTTPAPLTTARLTLRAPHRSDAPRIAALLTDNICQYIAGWTWPVSVQDADANLQTCLNEDARGHSRSFVICDSNNAAPLGWLRLFLTPNASELAYWIGEDHQGKGYATEAITAAIRYAFDSLNTPAVTAGLFAGNHPSRALLRKLGFTPLAPGSPFATHRDECSTCDYLHLPRPAPDPGQT